MNGTRQELVEGSEMKFVPTDHIGHNVYGSETGHYSGTIESYSGNLWGVGENLADVGTIINIEGCYDCDVEFRGAE